MKEGKCAETIGAGEPEKFAAKYCDIGFIYINIYDAFPKRCSCFISEVFLEHKKNWETW